MVSAKFVGECYRVKKVVVIFKVQYNVTVDHSADPSTMVDHFIQFGTSANLAKSRCSFMHLVWFASSWVIWKERNVGLFCAKENTPSQLLENIRVLSYSWYKAKFVIYHYKFYDWCQNLFHIWV